MAGCKRENCDSRRELLAFRVLYAILFMMITVEVRFFGGSELFTQRLPAALQQELPFVRLPDGATVDDLLRLLQIPTDEGRPLVSVNRFHRRDNVPLADGDCVQLFKTVVGGAS